MKKILRKVCTFENNTYLCIRNQEISSYKTRQRVLNRKIQNCFKKKLEKSLQKVLEKFGGLKKRSYLCTTFRFEMTKWFFKRFFDLLVI